MTPEEVLVLYGRACFEGDRHQRVDALRLACTEDIDVGVQAYGDAPADV